MIRLIVTIIGCLSIVNAYSMLKTVPFESSNDDDISSSDELPVEVIFEWKLFQQKYSKKYDEIEHAIRRQIFVENKKIVEKHNKRYELGEVSFQMGLNEFSDLSHEEFVGQMNGLVYNSTMRAGQNLFFEASSQADNIPKSIDWRDKGAVTEVKNQGGCGACWSFSATGAVEGQHFLKTGKLVSLSEQNLIDCSTSYGSKGCNGGLMDEAFRYIEDNGGIDIEAKYPYEGTNGHCRYKRENIGASIDSFVAIKEGDESALQEAIAKIGPISIGIDAKHRSFQFYSAGIYAEPDCSATKLNHAVLAVGYGTDGNGNDYYIVKNSWGPRWGENGYFRIARNKDNVCGLASLASVPIV